MQACAASIAVISENITVLKSYRMAPCPPRNFLNIHAREKNLLLKLMYNTILVWDVFLKSCDFFFILSIENEIYMHNQSPPHHPQNFLKHIYIYFTVGKTQQILTIYYHNYNGNQKKDMKSNENAKITLY